MQHNSEGGVTTKRLNLMAVKMCLINHHVLKSTLSSHCAHWLCFIFVAPQIRLLFVDLCVCVCVFFWREVQYWGLKPEASAWEAPTLPLSYNPDHCSERVYSQVISEQRIWSLISALSPTLVDTGVCVVLFIHLVHRIWNLWWQFKNRKQTFLFYTQKSCFVYFWI